MSNYCSLFSPATKQICTPYVCDPLWVCCLYLVWSCAQEGDSVGQSGGEGLNRAVQLKQKLLEFDQTRYAHYERHVLYCTVLYCTVLYYTVLYCTAVLTLTGMVWHMLWQLLAHSWDKQVGVLSRPAKTGHVVNVYRPTHCSP